MRMNIIKIDINTVIRHFNNGLGSRRIAKEMNCSRDEVRKVFKKFNLRNAKWGLSKGVASIDEIAYKIIKDNVSGCWQWQGTKYKDGYGVITYNGKRRLLHRVVYELMIAPVPDNLFVCHKCDNPCCCNPEHLFIGDASANMVDCILKNRSPHQKIGVKEVLEIRARYANGEMPSVISKSYELTIAHTRSIIKRRRWRCV